MITTLPLLWAALAACGDKGDTDTGGGDDTGGGEHGLTLTTDEVPREGDLWTEATWTGTVNSEGVNATISYTEWWDSDAPHCTAELALMGTALSGDCDGSCTGNDWGWSLSATPASTDGECTFKQPDNAPGLSGAQYSHFIAHFTDVDSPFGAMEEMLTLGYYSAQGESTSYPYLYDGASNTATGWDTTGALNYASQVGTGQPRLWDVCGGSADIESTEAFISDAAQTGSTGQDLSDVWTLSGKAGQTLKAGVDVTGDTSPRLALVDPDGCLVGEVFLAVQCSSGAWDCPAITYELPSDGVWSLVVSNLSGAAMEYSLSAELE